MKKCPVCGQTYEDHVQFCPADGASLVAVPVSAQVPTVATNTGAAAGSTLDQPIGDPDDLVGRRIFGDYTVRKKLGEGGMGAVYLAENPNIGQKIAVKVLHSYAAQSEELVQRFNREAQAISRLTHPNIIRVFIFGSTDDFIYLAMEFVEGKPLRDVIFEASYLDELRTIKLMRQCLHALNEAHDMGIVHRDLKPDNIMITRFRGVEEFVKVLDFGIAKVKEPDGSSQKLTQAGVVYGTPEYLSPEQAQAKELDGRSDLYSMGIILYEMVTGTVPFQSKTAVAVLASHVYEEPKKPSDLARHTISPEMERIIMKAIQKDPRKRYQTAMEFLADLEALEGKLLGAAATRTTVLDASQLSLVFEVSKAAERQKAQNAAAAAKDAPTKVLPNNQPPAPVVETRVVPGKDPRTPIFVTVIVGLVALVLMMALALYFVGRKVQARSADLAPTAVVIDVERA